MRRRVGDGVSVRLVTMVPARGIDSRRAGSPCEAPSSVAYRPGVQIVATLTPLIERYVKERDAGCGDFVIRKGYKESPPEALKAGSCVAGRFLAAFVVS
jgi:hypothetical protein